MTDDTKLPPLPGDVTSLFEEERGAITPALSDDARSRLRSRIDALAPIGLLGGGDGGSGGAGSAGSAGSAGAAGAAGAVKGALASKLAIAAIAFGVGSGTGAAVHATWTAPPPSAATPIAAATATARPLESASGGPSADVDRSTPPSPSSSGVSVADLPNVTAPKGSDLARPRAAPSASASAESGADGLKKERTTLEVARTAITRSDYGGALDALDRHAKAFPRGQLAEEREVMRIQALVGQGRNAEAKARAADFRRDFPQSLMQGAVDRTVSGLP